MRPTTLQIAELIEAGDVLAMYRLRPSPRPPELQRNKEPLSLHDAAVDFICRAYTSTCTIDHHNRCQSIAELGLLVELSTAALDITEQPVRIALQHPIGPYRADFAFITQGMRFIVEVDGLAFHAGRWEEDAERDRRIEALRWTVFRVRARDILIERKYCRWVAQACVDMITKRRSIISVMAGGLDFPSTLEAEHPEFVVPRGVCLDCRGRGYSHAYADEFGDRDDEPCFTCNGSGREPRGTFRDLHFWDVESEAEAHGLSRLISRD